ncbi:MAG: hypothetical protein Q6354_03965 [Candidatus Brocadiales bacterium]|nr:hypothetical protein [Candidatus Brocadiales bacterium]
MSKIRVRHGENEIELDGTDDFIKKHLDDFYSRIRVTSSGETMTTLKEKIFEASSKKTRGKVPTPAEYLKAKGTTDRILQILIFGKYLEEFREISEFSPQEINSVAKEARLSKDIHTQYFTNAVKQGLLRSLGGGKYTLTLSAEDALRPMHVN